MVCACVCGGGRACVRGEMNLESQYRPVYDVNNITQVMELM